MWTFEHRYYLLTLNITETSLDISYKDAFSIFYREILEIKNNKKKTTDWINDKHI